MMSITTSMAQYLVWKLVQGDSQRRRDANLHAKRVRGRESQTVREIIESVGDDGKIARGIDMLMHGGPLVG